MIPTASININKRPGPGRPRANGNVYSSSHSKKRKMSETNIKLKGIANDQNSRVQSRKGNRLSQSGFNSGLQNKKPIMSAKTKDPEVIRSSHKLQKQITNDDSEGEAGDAKIYAEKAGGINPIPKFEKSVFDMKYEQKQHQLFKSNRKQNHLEREKKIDSEAKARRAQDQLQTYPSDFPLAHPTQQNLRFEHPQRMTAKFQEGKDTITFDSDFCSGNLSKVTKYQKNEYLLWVSHDGAPYQDDGYKTWFYFSVKGVP